MPSYHAEFQFRSSLLETRTALGWIEARLEELGLGERRHDILIASGEALTNIVRHGYGGNTEGVVKVLISGNSDCMTISFLDDSISSIDLAELYNHPALKPDTEILPNLEESGRGVLLIRALSDAIEFSRKNERNCLSLSFKL